MANIPRYTAIHQKSQNLVIPLEKGSNRFAIPSTPLGPTKFYVDIILTKYATIKFQCIEIDNRGQGPRIRKSRVLIEYTQTKCSCRSCN